MKHTAGTFESSDCLIHVSPHASTKITIESVVMEQFGEAIHRVLSATLAEFGVTNVLVECCDKGALDYTIKSRLETALK